MSGEGKPRSSPAKRGWFPGSGAITRIASATGSLVLSAAGTVGRCARAGAPAGGARQTLEVVAQADSGPAPPGAATSATRT